MPDNPLSQARKACVDHSPIYISHLHAIRAYNAAQNHILGVRAGVEGLILML